MSLLFVNREVKAEFLENLNWALRFKSLKLSCDFAGAAGENLELLALKQIVKVRQLTNELLKQNTASLNKLSIVIVLHLHV